MWSRSSNYVVFLRLISLYPFFTHPDPAGCPRKLTHVSYNTPVNFDFWWVWPTGSIHRGQEESQLKIFVHLCSIFGPSITSSGYISMVTVTRWTWQDHWEMGREPQIGMGETAFPWEGRGWEVLEVAGLKLQQACDRFPYPWVKIKKLAWLMTQQEEAYTEYAWAGKVTAHMYCGG